MGSLLESPRFPVGVVNQAAAKEKQGGGRPEFWEMVFWWTRKPLASARAVLAAAALPSDASASTFVSQVLRARVNMRGDVENVPHRENPNPPPEWRERFAKMKVLDPFAGFGSIPLEAIRLGFGEVVAVELLPTAYVFLKAVLEYPKWAVEKGLGERLVKDVERWGRWVAEQLAQDPDIKELYDPDVAVYIGTWEVKCPHCGNYTPLIGNWWLARVSKTSAEEEESGEGEEEGARSGFFSRLAWMDWENGSVKVVDLNRELKAKLIKAKVNAKQGYVEVGGRKYNVRRPNIDARREAATCLLCGNQIRYYLPKLNRHSVEKPKGAEAVWYVKHALREWNRLLEEYLSGRIELEKLLESPAKPTLLAKVKVKEGDLEFEPATNQDIRKLWNALEKLRLMWSDPDIPIELFAPYQMGTAGAFRITLWGFDKWFKLFNPRQLLTLVKLVKLVREAGKRVEEEKLREGWSKEDAFKYAEAVATYLAMAVCKYTDYSSIVTGWHPGFWGIIKVQHTLAVRGIAMQWNWSDVNPYVSNIPLSYSSIVRIYIVSALQYLIFTVPKNPNRIRVLCDDATILSNLSDEDFDLVVTDPPYRDDVPYVELSDFFYVWLKRTLSNVSNGKLVPRFLSEAFFKHVGATYREIRTQWEELAPREVGLNVGRLSYFSGREVSEKEARRYFIDLLHRSFLSMRRLLKDDGLLVTYYAHTDPEAWEELISAGWRAGFRVTAAFPVATESAQRVTARGKAALDTSIVVVWRPGVKGEALWDQVYREALASAEERALELLRAGRSGVDLFVGTLAATLLAVTSKEKIVGVDDVGAFVRERAYPAAARGLARAISRYVGGGEAGEEVGDAGALFYMLAKILLPRSSRAGRRVMDRSTVHIIGFGTGLDDRELVKLGIVEKRDSDFHLLEPRGGGRGELVELLRERDLDPAKPQLRCAVDALHLLEYYAATLDAKSFGEQYAKLRSLNAVLIDEALRLARVLSGRLLPLGDPEKVLCERVISYAVGSGTLEGWLRGG
jgi:putative DNA methylase